MPYSVFVLQLITKNDFEDTPRLTGDVMQVVRRWCKPAMHAKRNIGFVIVTDETLQDLGQRLWDDMRRLIDLGRIERFFLWPAPEEVFSDHGNLDSLMHWMRAGRVEAGQRNKPHNVRDRQRRQRGYGGPIHNFKHSTVR